MEVSGQLHAPAALPQGRAPDTPSHIKYLRIEIYRTVILSVVLYGCEAWSVSHFMGGTQTEGYENSVLRRKFARNRKNISNTIQVEVIRVVTAVVLR
jgi:hypothetical protein